MEGSWGQTSFSNALSLCSDIQDENLELQIACSRLKTHLTALKVLDETTVGLIATIAKCNHTVNKKSHCLQTHLWETAPQIRTEAIRELSDDFHHVMSERLIKIRAEGVQPPPHKRRRSVTATGLVIKDRNTTVVAGRY